MGGLRVAATISGVTADIFSADSAKARAALLAARLRRAEVIAMESAANEMQMALDEASEMHVENSRYLEKIRADQVTSRGAGPARFCSRRASERIFAVAATC